MIDTPQKAAQNPWIIRFGIILAIRNNRTIFIIILNNPNVKIMVGKVTNFRIGLSKELNIPKIAPTVNRSSQLP